MKKLSILLVILFSIPMVAMTSEQQDRVRQSWLARNASTTSQSQECKICLEDKSRAEFVTFSCQHDYCQACLEYLVNQAIREKNTNQLKCPNPECARTICQEGIRNITNNDQTKIDAIAEIMTRELLARDAETKQCPTPDCLYAFINSEGYREIVTCPQCDQIYCSACLFNHPNAITCKQADDLRPSDKETAEWLQQHTKPCPNCNVRVERNGGCLYMTCKMCKKSFCWNCNMDHHATYCNQPAAQPVVQPVSLIDNQAIDLPNRRLNQPQAYIHTFEPNGRRFRIIVCFDRTRIEGVLFTTFFDNFFRLFTTQPIFARHPIMRNRIMLLRRNFKEIEFVFNALVDRAEFQRMLDRANNIPLRHH